MSSNDIVRGWKDTELTGAAPEHPAGLVELSSAEYGGLRNQTNGILTVGCCDTDSSGCWTLRTWEPIC